MLNVTNAAERFFAWLFYQDEIKFSSNVKWELGLGYKIDNVVYESPYTTYQLSANLFDFAHNNNSTFSLLNNQEINFIPIKDFDEMEIPTVIYLKSIDGNNEAIVYNSTLSVPITSTSLSVHFSKKALSIIFATTDINLTSNIEWEIAYSQFNLEATSLYTPSYLQIGLWTSDSAPPSDIKEPALDTGYAPIRVTYSDMSLSKIRLNNRILYTCYNAIDLEFPVYLSNDQQEVSYFYLQHIDTDGIAHLLGWGMLNEPVTLIENKMPIFAVGELQITTNNSYLS